jgi:hypothetical protein
MVLGEGHLHFCLLLVVIFVVCDIYKNEKCLTICHHAVKFLMQKKRLEIFLFLVFVFFF